MNPIYPWGQRLPIFDEITLAVGILSLVATSFLWKLKQLGGYLGIISFVIAFAVNTYVGERLELLHEVSTKTLRGEEHFTLPSWAKLSERANYFAVSTLLRRRGNQSTFHRLKDTGLFYGL